ncbi:protein kinase-like protein [Metarhizium album ARSEF 1941]|uniref:Protein kinase-like protein n=1 Tax=Metarhizium album (strain ARSEF 1941) TaxID=1081103 RepID=A0A0B2WLH4_METAS|nr:protein kinase-like protein [Metarhizium album ARSEF 1941]KHN96916.1 protein kinase-like protein [Metarhizium album ARSEF 1941]
MDFLKNAVASAIATGPPFPYSFGDKVDIDESVFTLYNGTKREDGSNCSIFSFDITASRGRLPLARNALKKLRTMRHPGVIKVLDTVETETYIYIATERVVPLRWHVRRKSLAPETIKWGLHSIARTIKFINTDASSIHGNLKVGSVYTSESGEWKLGGFEVLSSVKDDESAIYTYGSLVPDSARYAPPELAQGGWDVIKKNPHSAVDSFNFGVLIFETFNSDYNGSSQAGQTKNIPPTMQSSYKRLCNANPKARIAVSAFLDQGNRTGSFFDSPLIKLTDGIDNLGMKSPSEREEFLSDLDQLTDDFPEDFFKMKVLPELIKSVEFGGGGPKALGVILKIAANMSNDDFDTKMTPFIIKMFANPDRAIRVYLLDSLPLIIERVPQKVVNDKLFPHIVTGFTDVQPVVREQTLKSVLLLVGKLSDRTINGDLLKQLAKTANDEQPGIRTNTTICLGKIAKHLGTSSRSKVLIAAFTRSLRDPFVHARNAALMSLAATAEYFTEEDCAVRIIPLVCPLMIDKERMIRDQANRTIDSFLQKVRKAASAMPDTVLPPATAGESQPARMGTPQQSGSAGWTGWAISSFTNKLSSAAGDMQTANGGSDVNSAKPTAAPGPQGRRLPNVSASTAHKQTVSSPSPQASRTTSPSASAVVDAFWPDDGFDDAGDGWGEMGDDDEVIPSSTTRKAPEKAVPFDEGEEPDFAGWLAAQAQKKPGSSKPLPKGLSKSTATKKPAAKPAAKPITKKIDMKPKQTEDDDGWGDGW